MEVSVRLAKEADVKNIHEIYLANFRECFGEKNRDEILEKRPDIKNPCLFYTKKNGKFWVLVGGEEILGIIGIHEIEYRKKAHGILRRFILRPDYRSKRLGEILLNQAESFARERGWEYILFTVCKAMKRSKNFYFRHGYEEFIKFAPQEFIEGNDDWYFRKKIL